MSYRDVLSGDVNYHTGKIVDEYASFCSKIEWADHFRLIQFLH